MFNIPRRFAGIRRFEQILGVLAKYELGFLLEKMRLKKKSLLSKKKSAKPAEIRLMFEELGGSFVKLGQLLSLRPDLIPAEYCDELSKLQDDVEPFSYEEVKHIIKAELKKPIGEVFASFEKKPTASASIGQVHIAKLKDGKKVAVKVMRPGIKALFETDLEILDYLARLIKHHVQQSLIDPEEIFQEFKEYTENELDYMREAYNIKGFMANFKHDRKVRIPLVYDELTTHKVLTMEFIEGFELRELLTRPEQHKDVDKKKIAGTLVYSVMKQIFMDGLFHADPHPGNILVTGKDTISFIDFGITGRIDNDMKEKLCRLFISLMHRDTDGIVESFISLNMVDAYVDADALKKDIRETLCEYYDTTLNKIDMADLFFKSIAVAKKHSIKLSRDFVLLGKTLVTLQGVGIELDPGFNLIRETAPFVHNLAKQKAKPADILKKIIDEATRFGGFIHDLPGDSKKVFRAMDKADVALDTINTDLRGLTRELRVESSRLIMGMIIAAFVIGASLTSSTSPGMSKVFIVLAAVILAYLALSILIDSFRNRR